MNMNDAFFVFPVPDNVRTRLFDLAHMDAEQFTLTDAITDLRRLLAGNSKSATFHADQWGQGIVRRVRVTMDFAEIPLRSIGWTHQVIDGEDVLVFPDDPDVLIPDFESVGQTAPDPFVLRLDAYPAFIIHNGRRIVINNARGEFPKEPDWSESLASLDVFVADFGKTEIRTKDIHGQVPIPDIYADWQHGLKYLLFMVGELIDSGGAQEIIGAGAKQ